MLVGVGNMRMVIMMRRRMVTMVIMRRRDDYIMADVVLVIRDGCPDPRGNRLGCPYPQTTRPEKKLKTAGHGTRQAKVTNDQKKKHS